MRLLTLQLGDGSTRTSHGHHRSFEPGPRGLEHGNAAALRDARAYRCHAGTAQRDRASARLAHRTFAFRDDAIDDGAFAPCHLRHHAILVPEASKLTLRRNMAHGDAVTILEAAATLVVDETHRLRPDSDDGVRPAAGPCGTHRGFARPDHGNLDGRARRFDAVVGEGIDHDRVTALPRGLLGRIDIAEIDDQPLVWREGEGRKPWVDELCGDVGASELAQMCRQIQAGSATADDSDAHAGQTRRRIRLGQRRFLTAPWLASRLADFR